MIKIVNALTWPSARGDGKTCFIIGIGHSAHACECKNVSHGQKPCLRLELGLVLSASTENLFRSRFTADCQLRISWPSFNRELAKCLGDIFCD